MNVLIVGGGGREHCLAWKMAQSPNIGDLWIAPGNAGTATLGRNVALEVAPPFDAVRQFVKDNSIDLTVVGPEQPLVDGLADALREDGAMVFGPGAVAARLEGSKDFAKELMTEAGVPTGAHRTFDNRPDAETYLRKIHAPYVIKYDGLAAGKGVSIHANIGEADAQLRSIFDAARFGKSGIRVVIEEYLYGQEASVLAFVDGERVVAMEAAQDHKQVAEGDRGPNTGGMGAYSPTPVVDAETMARVQTEILEPTLATLKRRGVEYVGVLYAGLMIADDGPKVIEYNCRFGDPETQCVLPRLKNDLLEVLVACCEGRLHETPLEWDARTAVGVVAAAGGYPGDYEKGHPITGIEAADTIEDCVVFHAGTTLTDDGRILTSGGRVLCATALGDDLRAAKSRAYSAIDLIAFQDKYLRRDIGDRVLNLE